jgi:hypothetical protein
LLKKVISKIHLKITILVIVEIILIVGSFSAIAYFQSQRRHDPSKTIEEAHGGQIWCRNNDHAREQHLPLVYRYENLTPRYRRH